MEHTLRSWVQKHLTLDWDDHTEVINHVVEHQHCWLEWLNTPDPTWDCEFVTIMQNLNESTNLAPWARMTPWYLHTVWGWTSDALEAQHPLAEKVLNFLLDMLFHLRTKQSAEMTSLLIRWWELTEQHQFSIRHDPRWKIILSKVPAERMITELIYATDTTRPLLYPLWMDQLHTIPWSKDTAHWLRTLNQPYLLVYEVLTKVQSDEYGWALLHLLYPDESDHWCMAEQINIHPSACYENRFSQNNSTLSLIADE